MNIAQLRFVCVVVSVLLLAACANTRLYDAGADEAAKKASDAIIAADLKSALGPERASMQEFAKREQDAVKRDQVGLRDRKIVAYLSATTAEYSWTALVTDLDSRLDDLAGSGQAAKGILAAVDKRDDTAGKLPALRQSYLILAGKRAAVSCPVTTAQRPTSPELSISLLPYEDACKRYLAATKELANAMSSGEVGALIAKVRGIEGAQKTFDSALETARKNYEEALASSRAPTSATPKSKALDRLKDTFQQLGEVPKPAKLLEDKILAKLTDSAQLEQLKAQAKGIEALVRAWQGTVPETGATTAQERLAVLGELTRAIQSPAPPPLTALILEAEHLRLETVGVERHIQRAKDRIALLRKKQASMVEELVFLNDAKKALGDFDKSSGCRRLTTLYEGFRNANPNCRFLLAQVLSSYVNAATFGATEQELIDYQLIAQGHEAALDDSEIALAQTDNLMRLPAASLSKAYAGGIKPDQIANLLGAFGIGAIAVRVK